MSITIIQKIVVIINKMKTIKITIIMKKKVKKNKFSLMQRKKIKIIKKMGKII